MDVKTMKTELPKWPNYVQPLIKACAEMEAENGVPMPTYGLAMISAGMLVVAETCSPEVAATALIAALDELRDKHPDRVELAERVHRQRQN